MVLISCLLLFCLVVVCFSYWYKRPKGFPPGPRGIPFLGIIPRLGNFPEKSLFKWSKMYGPVMSLRMGRKDWVSLNDYDSIYKALSKQHTKFSGRPVLPVFAQFNQGSGIVRIDYAALWKSQRKFGLNTLRGFGVGKRSMEERILKETTFLNDWIRSQNGNAFSPVVVLHKATASNIASIIYGKRFEYNDKTFNRLIDSITGVYDDADANFALQCMNLAPVLMHVPPFSKLNALILEKYRTILEICQQIVEQHKKTFQEDELRDFIDAFLKEMYEGNAGFTDKQLLHYLRHLLGAGTDTTATMLNWSLIFLLHYPEVQKKLRNEAMKIVGRSTPVKMTFKSDMPYTKAFIEEVLRYRTIVPLAVAHKTNENSELNGHVIPKDTAVLVNLWAVHNDPDYWDEPEIFKPERFIDDQGRFVKSSHVIPFSLGPRHCLGEQLAQMEIFIFLVSLIQNFEFVPDPNSGELPPLDSPSSGFIFTPPPYTLAAKEL
ncbi:unnamed protein product [Clavelina lepadiformis]|uniref:Cytochrome P450 n=1 Tax=Clavelina lepadiformis TaxID=159417 RepID=A0ABP0GXF3_CLALP